MNFWLNMDEEYYVKLIVGGENPSFEALLPRPLAGLWLLQRVPPARCTCLARSFRCTSTATRSGCRRDTCHAGLPFALPEGEPARVSTWRTSRPSSRRWPRTRRWCRRIEQHVVSVCNAVERNTVVFFPSYSSDGPLPSMTGSLRRIKRKVHLEAKGHAAGRADGHGLPVQEGRARAGRCCSR